MNEPADCLDTDQLLDFAESLQSTRDALLRMAAAHPSPAVDRALKVAARACGGSAMALRAVVGAVFVWEAQPDRYKRHAMREQRRKDRRSDDS